MSWIGIITGDIVNSTEILNSGHREKLLSTLHKTIADINTANNWGKVKIEIYRGDSFQIIVENAENVLETAILIRAALVANSKENIRWDARLGVGVGKSEFMTDSIAESDGEAFRLSGQAFDNLGKYRRMAVFTPNDDFNEELSVSTAFADNIISNWTVVQASVIFSYLLNPVLQKELAITVGKTPQNINKLFATGKLYLILDFRTRFISKIKKLKL